MPPRDLAKPATPIADLDPRSMRITGMGAARMVDWAGGRPKTAAGEDGRVSLACRPAPKLSGKAPAKRFRLRIAYPAATACQCRPEPQAPGRWAQLAALHVHASKGFAHFLDAARWRHPSTPPLLISTSCIQVVCSNTPACSDHGTLGRKGGGAARPESRQEHRTEIILPLLLGIRSQYQPDIGHARHPQHRTCPPRCRTPPMSRPHRARRQRMER